jgi:hypothetical protein
VRFTRAQYEHAIAALTSGLGQLEPEAACCAICGDSGHLAFECGHNPLVAMAMCEAIARRANELHDHVHVLLVAKQRRAVMLALVDRLHEYLHEIAGHDSYMGVQTGPARVVLP